MFDWGSGVCLWSTNDLAINRYGFAVNSSDLPITNSLKDELDYLIVWHDEALNWDEPNSDLLWNNEQIREFLEVAKKAYSSLCKQLGPDYDIEFIERM